MPEVKPQVFIVDDDQGVRESIKILMRSIGVGSETFPQTIFSRHTVRTCQDALFWMYVCPE
jgi:FixJ family two-component response regulator